MRTTSDFVFFYGGPFSQWYSSKFEIDGVEFNTAEQFMMAKKAEYFTDAEAYNKIMDSDNPSEQKAIGRTIKNFNKEAWDSVSRGFVYKGNIAKFTQNPRLLKQLKQTGSRELVEASPYDKIWGIGLSENDPKVNDKKNWKGTNWLGETLMKVRQDLDNKENK